MTYETFDQGEDEKLPDQQKDDDKDKYKDTDNDKKKHLENYFTQLIPTHPSHTYSLHSKKKSRIMSTFKE